MYKNRNYKPLTPEEKFEKMIQKFLKQSKEIEREAGHKKHTKSEEIENKTINNERRKIALARKNKTYKDKI